VPGYWEQALIAMLSRVRVATRGAGGHPQPSREAVSYGATLVASVVAVVVPLADVVVLLADVPPVQGWPAPALVPALDVLAPPVVAAWPWVVDDAAVPGFTGGAVGHIWLSPVMSCWWILLSVLAPATPV
jgi:hypothetical protein